MQQRKKVVYLDQYFVSNLAKAIHLNDWQDVLAPFYKQLLSLLSDLTDADKIICPTSPFHREEGELSNRINEFLWHFVEQLGYGLTFKHSAEIKKNQIISAAQTYCGSPVTQRSAWDVAFNRDPQLPVGQLSRPALLVSIPNSQEFNQYARLSKTSIADEYWNYKKHCRGKRKAYSDELDAQKKQLILEMFMLPPRLNIKPSNLEQLFNLLGLAGVIEFHRSVCEILQRSTNPTGFFVSTQLLGCPFIHIWASLMAADIFFFPDKQPDGSFFMDFEIVSSVLPYTDILTIDSYISDLIRRARLSDIFDAHIFTVRQRKKLVAELQSL